MPSNRLGMPILNFSEIIVGIVNNINAKIHIKTFDMLPHTIWNIILKITNSLNIK